MNSTTCRRNTCSDSDHIPIVVVVPRPVIEEGMHKLRQRLRIFGAKIRELGHVIKPLACPLANLPARLFAHEISHNG